MNKAVHKIYLCIFNVYIMHLLNICIECKTPLAGHRIKIVYFIRQNFFFMH